MNSLGSRSHTPHFGPYVISAKQPWEPSLYHVANSIQKSIQDSLRKKFGLTMNINTSRDFFPDFAGSVSMGNQCVTSPDKRLVGHCARSRLRPFERNLHSFAKTVADAMCDSWSSAKPLHLNLLQRNCDLWYSP